MFALKVPNPRHRRTVGHPEWCVHGSRPLPRQPWVMSGLTRQTASHPAPTMVLTWRHVCWAPLTVAPEAALHTPVSPDHPVCPKCPPGRHSWEPPTGRRVWAGMSRPHTVGLCVQALPTPTTAAGGPQRPHWSHRGPIDAWALRLEVAASKLRLAWLPEGVGEFTEGRGARRRMVLRKRA